jgi:hypothetical protein
MDNKKQKANSDIFSKNEETVIKAIEIIRESGNIKDLENLAKVYSKIKSEKIQSMIFNVFCDLKTQESANTVVNLIKTEHNADILKMLVSSCWQSRLDYADSFEVFIDLVFSAPFETAFDAFTLIENFENKISESRKNKLINYVKTNISKCAENNKTFALELIKIIDKY